MAMCPQRMPVSKPDDIFPTVIFIRNDTFEDRNTATQQKENTCTCPCSVVVERMIMLPLHQNCGGLRSSQNEPVEKIRLEVGRASNDRARSLFERINSIG